MGISLLLTVEGLVSFMELIRFNLSYHVLSRHRCFSSVISFSSKFNIMAMMNIEKIASKACSTRARVVSLLEDSCKIIL